MGITEVARQAGLKEEQVKAVFEAIKGSNEPVQIRGFGTFKMVTRAARKGINPKTQAPIDIPAKTVLTFKPSPPKK